jgi:hypothetical protein
MNLDDGCAIMSSGQSAAVVGRSAFIERAEGAPITSANIRSTAHVALTSSARHP